ncbi:hypothetical protein PIB30_068752 [Stylosanthes scabra]|uniref:Zinc finger GRF-type domain-containing protein n=1 Tax=Stylosanthes scabra TaxID=79078 RepID=A0ABU6VNY1_9FABA|nr:hypothetical protein [Stylosanthes scabra]
MNGCGSQQVPGSSMRSTTRTPSRSRATGVPEWCGCGCRPVLRWLGTKSNPNKPFFGCPNYNWKEVVWVVLWADVGGEEMFGKEDLTMDIDQGKLNLAWRMEKLEAELRTLKLYIVVLMLVVILMFGFWLIVICKV